MLPLLLVPVAFLFGYSCRQKDDQRYHCQHQENADTHSGFENTANYFAGAKRKD
jgi:hypothetical protein